MGWISSFQHYSVQSLACYLSEIAIELARYSFYFDIALCHSVNRHKLYSR
jgi:hypothetical protein